MKRDNGRGAARHPSNRALAQENRSIMGMVTAMLGAATAGLAEVFAFKPLRSRYNRSRHKPHQGEGERARRRKQIEAGTLTVSNGLVYNDRIFGNKIYPYPQAVPQGE